jgi:pimeloyl-ACP methyl ester carboxylesterase
MTDPMRAQLTPGGRRTVVATEAGTVAALRSDPPAGLAGGPAPTVLLVPGYTGSKEDFAPLLDPLAAAGFTTLAIDLPGQFESPGTGDPADYSPDRLARVLRAVAATLSDTSCVHLVGHSFGGLVARAAVIADPDRYASLVLIGSGPSALGGARRMLIDRLEPVLATSGLTAVYAASQALERTRPGYVEPPPVLAAFLERRFLAGAPAMLQGMGDALRAEPDRVDDLAAVAPPILVLSGERDDAWLPAVQDEMAERLGAERAVIAGAAHSPAVENPAATVAALVRFWNRVGRQP